MKPSIGRIVHYVLPEGAGFRDERAARTDGSAPQFGVGAHRPAIVTHVWPSDGSEHGGSVQLQVFIDNSNDELQFAEAPNLPATPMRWRTSVIHDEETKKPGTWHWPEREE